MLSINKGKLFSIFVVLIFSILLSLPSLIPSTRGVGPFTSETLNLGLDLRGGASILLELDFTSFENEQFQRNGDLIRSELRKDGIDFISVKSTQNAVEILTNNKNDIERTKKIAKEVFGTKLNFVENDQGLSFKIDDEASSKIREGLINQSIEIIRKRVDESGTREIDLVRQGDQYILLQVPGLEDPEQLKNLLGQTAKLSFHLVETGISPHEVVAGKQRLGLKVLPVKSDDPSKKFVAVVDSRPLMTGEALLDAQAAVNHLGAPVVNFKLTNHGAKIFAELTKNNIGRQLAIVLDNKVLSAPSIHEPILGGSGQINGAFSISDANELALLLRAGALPVPLKIVEERSVGPSLGSDSIASGTKAAVLGTLMVMLFMILFYGFFGLVANVALLVNLLLLIAVMVFIGATLTLPGIAGMVLTLGMAVDANVLIYERIREELNKGRSPLSAIETGFQMAVGTIIDSNLTTILAALVLYVFGSGPVKGFGVTLAIGIMCSMFTAITLSKTLIAVWFKKYRPKTLSI